MKRTTLQSIVSVLALMVALCLVFAAVIGGFFSYDGGDDTKTSKAQLGCMSIAVAIEAYIDNEANKTHEPPTALRDLVEPPFGGPSFLRNGEADLIDPWGKPYEMERVRRSDGTEYILVKTTAPDGTPISQHGIGPNARPHP
jgi:hypothetical protein